MNTKKKKTKKVETNEVIKTTPSVELCFMCGDTEAAHKGLVKGHVFASDNPFQSLSTEEDKLV